MSSAVNHRDLLLCVLAREQRLLSDDQLQKVVEVWLNQPKRSLQDVLAADGLLSAEQIEKLRAAADQRAAETCLDPVASHLRSLPRSVRSLLETGTQAGQSTTDAGRYETAPSGASPAAAEAIAAGALVPGDRFSILQLHAQGGLGVIYQARDAEIDRTVALKQIKPQWADDDESRTRFTLEAKITGRLEHPGIVPIYALGADQTGRPYYAMRLIRGESLLQVLERFHKTLATVKISSAQRTVQIRKLLGRFIDVCNALDYAHSHGIVHRDVKPANVMLGKFGETLVVDWGLAKVIGADEEAQPTSHLAWTPLPDADSKSTRMGVAVGTPAYMSPEQAAGRLGDISPASDVYSLGATLYQLLTGKLPHADEKDLGVMLARIERGHIIPPEQRCRWLPRPLTAICRRALNPIPAQRYPSARALAADVERWLADEPVQAHSESVAERVFRWMRNHRTLVISLIAVQIVAAAAAVAGVIGWNHFQTRRLEDELALEAQQEQRRVDRTAAAASALQSAAAEIRANRYSSALPLLHTAVTALTDLPQAKASSAAETLAAATAQRNRVANLVDYYQLAGEAEELIAFQYDTAARGKLLAALDRLDVFTHGDWWDHLPDADLTPEQADRLQRHVYRQLILLTANYAKGALGNLTGPEGASAAENTLAVAKRVQRFRPASSTRWHASFARARLGRGLPLRAAQLDPPQNAADAYMFAALAVIASQNPTIAAAFSIDSEDPLDRARRELLFSGALEPEHYWTHFVLGFTEMLAAGEPTATPREVSQPHYQNARRAFSQCIAIDSDYWLAYAERCNSYRQEIESRRAAGAENSNVGGETTAHLLEMMLRDLEQLRQRGAGETNVDWYAGFALHTAGHTDAAVNTMITALEKGARFDVDSDLRILDPEAQRALPETVQIANALLNKEPNNPRYLLLRGGAQLRLREFEAALADVESVLNAPDPPAFAYVVRGTVKLQRREFAAAIADFQRALSSEPQQVAAKIGLARTAEAQEDFEKALAIYDQAAPQAVTGYQTAAIQLGRSRSLLAQDHWSSALDAVAAARKAEASSEVASVRRLAEKLGQQAFLAKLDDLVREPAVAPRDAAQPPKFDTLPLLDGGFELGLGAHWNNLDAGDTAWRNVGDANAVAEVVADSQRGGRVLHLASPAAPTDGYGVTSQTAPADPAERYQLTLWAKAEQLSDAAVSVVIDDRHDEPIVYLPPGSYGWRKLTGKFDLAGSRRTKSEGLVPATIRIICRGRGEAWLDDLRIEAVRADTN